MASGDLGAPAYRKYDVEAWMPGLGRYGEVPWCNSALSLLFLQNNPLLVLHCTILYQANNLVNHIIGSDIKCIKLYRLSKSKIRNSFPSSRITITESKEGQTQTCTNTVCPHIKRNSLCYSPNDHMHTREFSTGRWLSDCP